jgi:hypothetical protein
MSLLALFDSKVTGSPGDSHSFFPFDGRQPRLCMSGSEYIFGVPRQLDPCFVAALTIDLTVLPFLSLPHFRFSLCTNSLHH